jgi:hypothetical protein
MNKSVPDAAPARDPNLSFGYNEAFEKLVEEERQDVPHLDEFTIKEFSERTGLGDRTAGNRLDKLLRSGKVTRRKYRTSWLYRVVA